MTKLKTRSREEVTTCLFKKLFKIPLACFSGLQD
eukprot:CAMPEP_0194590406 /NCGR_PEP_ID=MMETSP0292-20121207/21334_1 /TAXON_ID=39354 /ORGANISM="Heterosigma akashiwo, Strain CCMP2393" /LENGTH=33 /DNA_ID= /DNA_START= /DNA_END= /DNA_ORIENTATION=